MSEPNNLNRELHRLTNPERVRVMLRNGVMLRADLMRLLELDMGDIRRLRQAGVIEYVQDQGRPDYMRLGDRKEQTP